MKNLRLLATATACALALATAFLAASCSKTPAPEAFTAQLDNIDGAMAFYSLQHPKLISQGVNKLIAEVPDAAPLNMVLALYGGQLGYPEFTEIAAGTNIGIYQPVMSLDELKHGAAPAFILFVKLKENGKIWNLLVRQRHLKTQKQGDWTMFAKSTADFDAVKNPDAIIARLSTPQAETLRAWLCLDGETAAAYKTLITDAIANALDHGALPDAEKTAFAAYARALLGDILDSTHSGNITLNLGDTGATLAYGAQFKPDTPIGIFNRYRSGATPDIASYITNDALLTATFRYTPKAGKDLSDHMLDLLLKVDYPPISDPLAKFHKDFSLFWEQMDGCGAMTFTQNFGTTNPRMPYADTFVAYSGKFDRQTSRQYMQFTVDLAQKLATNMLDLISKRLAGIRAENLPRISITGSTDALTVAGVNFDAMTMNITGGAKDIHIPAQTTYFGVANGNFISASNEATLQKRLPALLAKKVQPGNIAAANPLRPYDIMSMSVNGAALTDMACSAARIDQTDTDAQATIADIKDSYQQSGPARLAIEARQAALTLKVDIPYKFISASVKLARYVYSASKAAGE